MHIRSFIVGLALANTPVSASGADVDLSRLVTPGDPEVSYAVNMMHVAEESVRWAGAVLRPNVTLRGQWLKRPFSGGYIGSSSVGRTLSLNLAIPVIDRAASHNLAAAQLGARAGAARVGAVTQQAMFRSAMASLAVERDQELLVLAEQNETTWAALVTLARLRLDAGLAAVGEVYEATSTQAAATRARVDARLNLDDSLVARRLLGSTPVPVPVADAPVPGPSWSSRHHSEAEREADVVGRALRHPRLLAAQYDAAASEQRLAAARVAHLPKLGLHATYGTSSTRQSPVWTRYGSPRKVRRSRATVTLTMEVPLFAPSSVTAIVRRGMFEREAKVDALDELRRGVVRDASRLYRRVRNDPLLLAATQRAVGAAEAARDAMEAGLVVGTHSWIQRLRSESRLTAARVEHCRARFAAFENDLALRQLTGELTYDSGRRPFWSNPRKTP